MRSSRAIAALLPLGALAGHALAYRVDHADTGGSGAAVVGHSHLPVLIALAVPLALAGVISAGLHGYRGHRLQPRVATIAAGQAVCYLLLEGAESLGAGRGLGELLATPTLWWGLGVQLLVAWAAAALLGAGARLGGRLRATIRQWPKTTAAHHLFRSWAGGARPAPSPTSRRGPPQPARS